MNRQEMSDIVSVIGESRHFLFTVPF